MADRQAGDQWDWDRPFDDDFVRGAATREDSGQARAERAARIAAEHRSARSWRSDRPQLDTRNRGPSSGSGSKRGFYAVLALLLIAALLVVTGVIGGSGSAGPETVQPSAPAAVVDPPVPSDARPTRIRPLPPEVPGTGGYRLTVIEGEAGSIRWDPCRPIHYVTRAGDTPRGGSALLQASFDALSAATGLQFVDDGVTAENPREDRSSVQISAAGARRFAPVLVAWSDAAESPLLKGSIAAYAGPDVGDDGRGLRLVSGTVVLDSPAFERMPAVSRRTVLLHELGHLVGLDHVTNPRDIMYAESGGPNEPSSYTPGAARGLRILGSGRCFS